jgi:hypothetical protein
MKYDYNTFKIILCALKSEVCGCVCLFRSTLIHHILFLVLEPSSRIHSGVVIYNSTFCTSFFV